MMKDSMLPDNVQDDQEQPFDAQPYCEYVSLIPSQTAQPSPPVPPSSWPTPNIPTVAPPTIVPPPGVQQQMTASPPGPPQPPFAPPAYWPAQEVMPLPAYAPSGPTRSSKKRGWAFSIVGVVCAIAVVLAGSYALYANLAQLSKRTTLSSTTTAQPSSVNSVFHTTACPFRPGIGITEGKELTCGFLTVPEDRSNAHSGTIQLAVAVFKPAPTVPADPMVYLSGGPGGALLSGWAPYVSTSTIQRMTQGHTLIMFDQRGTGYSRPVLNCSEFDQLNAETQDKILSRTEATSEVIATGQKCHNRLVNTGINLQAYTSIADANDVHDLIHALGYKQVDLYGVSYGTRLALTVMRLFPSDIRSAILDSTVPTQINLFNAIPVVTQHAYDTLFQGCAASPKCHAQYPQLESVFYQLINDLNAKPITFQDAQYGPIALDGDGMANWVFSMLYVTPWIALLPQAIMQTSQGNYAMLSRYYGILMYQEDFSYGVYYSVECGEDMAFTTTQQLANATVNMHPEVRPGMLAGLQSEFGICQLWGDKPVPTVQKQPVISSLPTLILSGEYDPITPASNAKLALQTLSHGYLFQFPATGHGVFNTHRCPDSIVAAFLQQPMTKPSDSCIATMSEPDFQ